MRLDGRSAVVTGTSPNIGAGIALALAEAGAAVTCLDLNGDVAALCAKEITAAGGGALGIGCDVTDETQVAHAIQAAAHEFGVVDILVNCAAFFNRKGVRDMPVEEWRRQVDVILTGTFLCTQAVVTALARAGKPGSIVNIVSTAGHQGEPNNVGYATAKGGLLNFTRSVAMEVAHLGIRVNSVTPTATDPTEGEARANRWGLPRSTVDVSELMAAIASKAPLQKLPRPWHYGRSVVFLCSDDAEMITGIDLRVDAGAVANYWLTGTL
jgi:NAD(P)-dependent dehydrogenase (short-subunit alcohol dehydrogenase family)